MFELTFNVYTLLMSIALIIALTFGFLLLFNRKVNRKADRFLAAVMLIIALWNASILIWSIGISQNAQGLIWFPLTYTLALGPCFYFYILSVSDIGHSSNNSPKIWPHFIPVVFEELLYLIEVFQGLPLGIAYFQTETFLIFDPIKSFLAITSFMIYSYFARKRIQLYHAWVENNYSHYHRYNLNWLYRMSTIFLGFLILWVGYFLVDFIIFEYKLNVNDYYPFHLTLAVISIWLCVEAFMKPDIIYPEKTVGFNKNDKSNLIPDKELLEKGSWLNKQIEKNLLFLDPELSLKSLSETLDIHPNVVSKIINEGLNQTFSDCINSFRVKAVVNKLKDGYYKKSTFLAIAFDCGFNSKTTFNRVFKNQMGQTPLQYRNKLTNS